MRQDVLTFLREVRATANLLAQANAKLTDLRDVYIDRQYNSGGSGAITAQDLADIASAYPGDPVITLADLSAFTTLAVEYLNFMDNKAVTQGDYGSTTNRLRNDV